MKTLTAGALLAFALALASVACTGDFSQMNPPNGADAAPGGTPDAGPTQFDDLDKGRAEARFQTTTDLVRFVIAPGCAAETNECHNTEDFPDLSTEGNLWNLANLPCNVGIGERETIEDFCEAVGDELRITDGENAGFTARVGSVRLVTDEMGEFLHYEVLVETPPGQIQTDGNFEFVRLGVPQPALGGGNSAATNAGSTTILVTDVDAIPDPGEVKQGDENRNGIFGDGFGVIVRPGDARGSYMVRRLLGADTERVRMPLNENADNPTELNSYLSPDQMYALMSWINCMLPTDTVYSPIRYDCEANADNDGTL
jgi:hypothetical protein